MVYIKEAHASDSRRSRKFELDGVLVRNHQDYAERVGVSIKACAKLNITMPNLVDSMDDTVNHTYSAWPDRLYIIGKDGKITKTANAAT